MRNVAEYHRPRHIEEALALLARTEIPTVPIGGGSQLIGSGRRDVQAVVDLRDLGLSYVRREEDALRVGATTPLQVLIDSPESAQAWNGELARVSGLTAARNLREQGTIAGTLVSAEGNNPVAALLLALGASVTLQPGGRAIALDAFFARRASLLTGSLMTEVAIPLPHPGESAAFEKVSRTPADVPIVCAAVRARIEGGVVHDVRIALGGVAPTPIRGPRIERRVEGQSPDRISFELADEDIDPTSDFMGSAAYRREMAAVLIRRAVTRLFQAA